MGAIKRSYEVIEAKERKCMISFPHLHVPQRQTCYMQTCRTIFLSADYFCSVSKYFAISVWARTGGLARLGLLCLAGRSSQLGPGVQ